MACVGMHCMELHGAPLANSVQSRRCGVVPGLPGLGVFVFACGGRHCGPDETSGVRRCSGGRAESQGYTRLDMPVRPALPCCGALIVFSQPRCQVLGTRYTENGIWRLL